MTTATNPATGATLDESAIRAKAATEERERATGIRQCAKVCGADEATIDRLIAEGVGLEAARSQLLGMAHERDKAAKVAPHLPATVTDDAKDKRARGIENAILHRTMPGKFDLTDEGRHYRGLTMLELARDFLESEGVSTRGMVPSDLAIRALHYRSGGVGYASTTDFGAILTSVPNKTMRKAYKDAPTTYQEIAVRATLKDFRNKYAVQLGAAPALERVNENGEFRRGSIVDGAETYGLETYGKMMQIGRRVIINDEMSALTRVPSKLAAAAKRLENLIVWSIVLDNAAMSDGKSIFHTDHRNIVDVGSGGGATVAQVSAMRSLLKMQLDLDGATRLSSTLRTIAVPDARYTEFEKFIGGELQAATQAEVIPSSMRGLKLITDPLLDDSSVKEWYGFAGMDEIDCIEYAFLEGEEGPSIDSEIDFDSDGLKIRIRHDFGAGCLDFRGCTRNAGE